MLSLGHENNSTVKVECAMFTSLKYSEEENVYRCNYSAWAYSLFALVGFLLVVLPFFLILCCILRKRSKRQQYRSYLRSESTYSHEYESPRQPLTPDGEVFTNYGAVENSCQDESQRGQLDHNQENRSTTSSHTSLLPNYDETSLNFRNALLNRNQLLCPNGKSTNEQQPWNPLDYRTNYQQPTDTGLYATVDIVPDSANQTGRGDCPIARNKTGGTKPIYDVLEGPEPDDAAQHDHQTHSNSKTAGATKTGDNSINSHVDGNLPVYVVLDGPSPYNESVPAVTEEKVAIDNAVPCYAVLEPPEPENLLNPSDMTEVNETPVVREDDLQNLNTDIRTDASDGAVDVSEDGCILSLDDQASAQQIEPLKTTGEREEKCTPPPLPTQIGSQDCYPKGEETSVLRAQQQRKKLESRAEYEMFLLEKVNELPENQRQGCYLIRDSMTSSGCKVLFLVCNFTLDNSRLIFNNQFIGFKSGIEKLSKIIDNNRMAAIHQGLMMSRLYNHVLTMYAAEPNSEKTLFSFKVCIDGDGQVYLGKSKTKFPTLDALLAYLRRNKDMLPCTITRQIVTEPAVDHLYEEVVA